MRLPSKYSPLIGLGVMYVWLLALLYWIPWWDSADNVKNFIALIGIGLASISCGAILIYANQLENMVKQLNSRDEELEDVQREFQARNATTAAEAVRLRNRSALTGSHPSD